MASVTYRGATSWSTQINSWPSGTVAGDLAVLTVIGEKRSFDGWTEHAVDVAGPFYYSTAFKLPQISVFSRIVPDSGGLPGTVQRSLVPTVGRVTTWQNASGIGRIRRLLPATATSTFSIPVRARGAALFVASIDNSTSSPSGATNIADAGVGGPWPGYATFLKAWARLAYATASEDALKFIWFLGRVLCLELLPRDEPLAPTLYTPQPGSDVSASADVTFEWQHNPTVTSGYQDAFRLRYRQVGSGTWYWVGAGGSQQASETTVSQAAQTIDLNVGVLSAGVDYEWQTATREAIDGLWSAYAASSEFTTVTPPSVSVTAPTTVSEDLTPTVEWTPTTPQGSQTAFRVTVDEVGYDSGVVRGTETQWTVPVQDWTNGGTYTAGVRVQQTGGSWSPEGTRQFTLSWTPPTTPTCTAANSATGGIDITSAGSDSGSVIEVQRTFDGVTWEDVTQSPVESDGSDVVVKDVTVRYGEGVIYRSRAATEIDGKLLYSSWDVATEVTSTDKGAYIVNSRDWTDYVSVNLRDSNQSRRRDSAVAYGLGDSRPMVDHSPYSGQAGQWTVQVSTVAQLEALADLVGVEDDVAAPPWPFILRFPPRTNDEADKSLTVAITGSLGWAAVGYAGSPYQDVTLTWVEQ